MVQWTGGFFAEWCEGGKLEVLNSWCKGGRGGNLDEGGFQLAGGKVRLSFWIHHESMYIYYQ